MFDLSRLTEVVSGLFGGTAATELLQGSELINVLNNAGIDPSQLAGLGEGQITDLLAEHGIDPSQFAAADLQSLASEFGLGDHLVGPVAGLFGIGDTEQR